eukprot:Nitzschia sp. Nitz4//scaffold7_size249615//134074//136019//NITZ4_001181-RA/size249615-augustus-gene-0.10-mRNA-1//1//CDS//3329558454//2805//frame0
MRICWLAHGVVVFIPVLSVLKVGNGFALAPNFITKQISQDIAAKEQPVKTRFPPEPNGFLHLGHAKSIFLNWEVARTFGGACNLRMDDTNPSKESQHFVESILDDVKWLQQGVHTDDTEVPWDGTIKRTSDYFEQIYQCAEILIQQGDAYIDSLTSQDMREYRGTLTEPGRNSPFRERSVQENLQLFREMRSGLHGDGELVLRAKIDMQSPNLNMRDPTLYRIKHEHHQETGDTWCIYPMYDFSHPIADALEGISHSLCTLEFQGHRPLYEWVIEKLLQSKALLNQPQQMEFSRLNIQHNVMSKRKLSQLVEQGHVVGWNDPRLLTISGLRRRGIPPLALQLFCDRIGISKADSNIPFSSLEECVREVMDEKCPRAFGVLKPLKLTITNWEDGLEDFEVPNHPQNADMGNRTIPFGKEIFIEREDFFDLDGPQGVANGNKKPKGYKRLLPSGKVRLRYAYVVQCDHVIRDPNTNEPIELQCTYFPETRAGFTPPDEKRVKGIIHWVESSTALRCKIHQYDRLFLTEEPGSVSGDFVTDLNPESLKVFDDAMVEPSLTSQVVQCLGSGKREGFGSNPSYQFERCGYFALDEGCTDLQNITFNRVATLKDSWAPKGAKKNTKKQA